MESVRLRKGEEGQESSRRGSEIEKKNENAEKD